MKLFCKAYESDEDAAGQLGVILSEHYLGDETMRRASLKDSYQFILDDLDRAAELLELEEDFDTDTQGTLYDSIYFNEYTVHALRARVLLYMKRWDEAIKYATKVIDSGSTTCRAVRAQPPQAPATTSICGRTTSPPKPSGKWALPLMPTAAH